MSWSQQDLSFKKLSNKRVTTSTGKGLSEEKGASSLELYLPDIKTELIPGTGSTASGLNGVLYYYGPTASSGQTLVVDTSVPGNLTWFASSGYGNTTIANDGSEASESLRLFNWVSDKFDSFGTVSGAGYEIKLYDNAGNLITKSDASNWLFDYQTGILLFNGATLSNGNPVSTSGPYRIVGWRYVGQKGTIPAYFGGSGYTTYTKGDLLVGAGATFIKFNVGTDNYILSADSTTDTGLKWVVNSGSGSGITVLNNLSPSTQFFAVGTSGSLFNISSSGSTHTFNIPIAGTGSTGLVSTIAQSFAGIKTFTNDVVVSSSTVSTSPTSGALVVTGGIGIGGSLYVSGDFTVNGTTTTINSVTLTVDDKNIELGSVASPTDLTAEGGGITLKGSTDKSINWYTGTGWSSSESWNLSSGQTYKINNTTVLSNSSLGTGVTNSSLTALGIISTGVWAATAITTLYGGTGNLTPFTVGDLLYANTSTTWARLAASSNTGYVLTSAGTGATPVYTNPATVTVGLATTSNNVNVVLASSNANHPLLFTPSTGTASGAAVSNDNTLVFNPLTETLTVSGLAVTSGLASTSTATGALIVTGGVGIGGSLYVNSASNISNVLMNNGTITGTLSGYATTSNNLRIASAGNSNLAHPVLFTPSSSTSGSAVSSDSTFSFNSSTEILSVSGLAVTNTTGSTSSSAGALTVAGGVGIGGTVNIQGDETVFGRLYYTQSTVGIAGTTVIPSISFIGQNNNPITLSVLSDNTLSFEGSSGQLFSINNNLSSGTIFSVNDISGIPILRANANGTLSMGEFSGNVGIGLSLPSYKLHVAGDTNLSSGYVYRINGNSVLSSTTLGTVVTNSSLTSVGTITSGTWAGTLITSLYGGTGYASYTKGDLLAGSGNTLVKVGSGTSNFVLSSHSMYPAGVGWTWVTAVGVGTSPPLNYHDSDLWWNANDGTLNLNYNDGDSSQWVEIAGGSGIDLSQPVHITSTVVSTDVYTGALIVDGGVGIQGALNTSSLAISGNLSVGSSVIAGSWAGNAVTARYGGTGYTSYTKGDLLVGAGSTFIKVGIGLSHQVLGYSPTSSSGLGWTDLSLSSPVSTNYGCFFSTVTQPVYGLNTITPVTVNSTYEAANIEIYGGAGTSSRVRILNGGVYNIQFSIQMNLSAGTQPKTGDFWFRINGSDVPWSNSRQTITGKDFQHIFSMNFVSTFNSGQYFELMMSSNDSNFILEATTSLTGPTRPDIPSVIYTVTKVL
jgi:hypothetical protein